VLLRDGRVHAAGDPSAVLVPENLETVYEVDVRRFDLDDGFQLAFRPRRGERP
jgi:iron complex transport system ATP-binding protein